MPINQISKYKVVIALILSQLIIIIFLTIQIYQKQNNILGSIGINPIKKEGLTFDSKTDLKFFYELKPNTNRIEGPSWLPHGIIYKINADGLNEIKDYSPTKPPNTYRIVTLGDSHTFGLYVQTSSNWSKLLENKLNNLQCKNRRNFEIINLGVPGYDIQYAIERYRIRGQKYNPDLVVWFIKGEDFYQINEIMLRIRSEIKKKSAGYTESDYLRMALDKLVKDYGENYLLKQNANMINQFNEYYNGKLIIMTYTKTKKKYSDLLDQFIKQRKDGYIFKDIPIMYQRNDLNFLPYNTHPNQKGHKLIAGNLFKYLKDNKIIPCK